MKLQNDLIITLEDGKSYFVVCTTTYNNELYGYLLDLSESDNHIYIKQLKTENENEMKLEKITNKSIIKEVALALQKAM